MVRIDRLALLAGPALGLLPAAAPAALAQSPECVAFETGDGSRFVLSPESDGPPVVHWVMLAPAGANEDPPGVEGLAYAAARAALAGTVQLGSVDWERERKVLDAADELERRVALLSASGEAVPTALLHELAEARRTAATLADPGAWRRAVLASPAAGLELVETEGASLLHVVTDAAALPRVGRLLVERREHAVLRGVRAHFAHVRERIETRSAGPVARLRREVLGLAHLGDARARAIADEPADWSREDALAVFRRTHDPRRSLHVLTGGFRVADVRPQLETIFASTELRSSSAFRRPGRAQTSNRISVIPGARQRGLALACELGEIRSRATLETLGVWLAGGEDSVLARGLRAAGFAGFEVAHRVPFPAAGPPELFLLEIVERQRDATGSRGLEPTILELLGQVLRSAPPQEEIAAAFERVAGRRAIASSTAEGRAFELAIACGLHGEDPATVLAPPSEPTIAEITAALGELLLKAKRFVVSLERGDSR